MPIAAYGKDSDLSARHVLVFGLPYNLQYCIEIVPRCALIHGNQRASFVVVVVVIGCAF